MKKFTVYAACALLLVLIAGCSVTSEKFRYQQRIDRFYNVLNQDEKTAFAAGDIALAGNSIDKRLAEDKKFAADYLAVQTDEAINTFDGQQTVRFFRDIILRELTRASFYRFMGKLDANAQFHFAVKSGFDEVLDAMASKKDFKDMLDYLRTEYRLAGFSNRQIADFFRNTSFPEVSRREFYHVLRVLKESSQNALADFKSGDTASAALKLDAAAAKLPTLANDLSDIRERSSLTKLGTAQFLDVYYKVIMKEMDQGAMKRTLEKF